MNPLEHHSFRNLLSSKVAVAESAEATFTLRSYYYRYFFYLKYEYRCKWWHLITLTNVSSWLLSQAKERGLLLVNGIPVCVSCHTSEFVKSDKKLNGGTPTCVNCNTTYRGWE